jgi:phosphohistidine phosphatase
MKLLTFIRHAKSDWGNEFLKDIDRPLAEKGYKDAYDLSTWYLKTHTQPDLIVSSTATRALNTALIFARTFNFNLANFKLEDKIYESSAKNLISIISKFDNQKNSIIMFGHNPGFTNVCNELTDDLFFENVPTCGIVSLQFDIKNWDEVSNKKAKLIFHQFPKDFKNND